MKKKLLRSIGPLFGLLLFAVALWVLRHELRAYHLHDVMRHLRELPAKRLWLALGLTVVSYLVMTGYDTLALRYIRHPLAYSKTALASFIAYAFSNNIGFSMIAGASVRYRLYSAWGLTAFEITQVIGFCTLTLWLGFFVLGGVVFLFEPLVLPAVLHFPFTSVHLLGRIFLAVVAAFILWSFLVKRPLKVGGWEFSLPSPGLLLSQITVASLDWALAGMVLYALLPSVPGLSYLGFMGLYLLAQLAGLVSQVPGGLGVFETVIMLLLSPYVPPSQALGSLLAYRGIYYIFPLLAATISLGIQEVFRKKAALQWVIQTFGQWGSVLVPQVLAFTTFVGGAIMLFSGATPAVSSRLAWLKNFMPLPVIEISHFLGSFVGGWLLLLARGLQRRIDAAYVLTALLLAGGIVFSLLKGADYEEAIILSVMLGALLPCRRHFYRSASLFGESFNPGWIAGIAAVLLCSVWLGLFSYKHVEFSGDLWWQFTLAGNASRFLRAIVGVVAVMLFFALARMLSPSQPMLSGRKQEDLERAGAIVQNSPRTYAGLALLGDKSFLFSQNGNAFIMYGIEGRSWVSMGDPIGREEEWPELTWQFRKMVDRYDGWTVFYEVGPENLHVYLDLGLTLLKLGEEARVRLAGFSLEGGARKGLRHTYHKLEGEGCTFEVIPAERVPTLLPELRRISDAWLEEKSTKEKGFSLGFFDEGYLKRFPAGMILKEGKIVAFANLWPGAGKEELSIDLMRHLPDAPRGVMEYLFIQLMLWGKGEGYRWFNLGMAPLSGLQDHGLAPLWNRAGAYIFRHGEHFYNFQGLRQYKEKFDPEWVPEYLACPGGLAVPRILANIATLVSGGMKGVIAK
ncbi:MAG TPA: bifunctional lysylphosphatidylglycerol flippase/synthetase MprF [Desulfatiglandales bacterium]|nr:bifunctional lysylphosphatidylglycerol flippase/synthetase MprF [Desulfatiglandales bacterium]